VSKILVAQGGGPTAVINQSLTGLVLEARRQAGIDKVYGALHGIRGIVNEDFVDLTGETAENLEGIAATPSSALGSTRDKPDLKYCQDIFRSLKAHGIESFFYIGGNDSSDTVRIVSEEAQKENYPLRSVHIPKTIDNDLMINDHTPGFPSAARFVAQAFMGANLDNRSLPGIYMAVIMGRHAGFLTAAAAAARVFPDDGPHLVYVPERAFHEENFLTEVKKVMDKHGRCVVALSEGIADDKHVPIATKLMTSVSKDAHGNVELAGGALADSLTQLVKDRLGYKRVRADTFGYVQRSFFGCVSDVDQREAREAGAAALRFALNEGRDGSVTIHRVGDYKVDYRLSRLEDIGGKTRVMPDDFIAPSGSDVTDKFFAYLKPLLGSGVPVPYRVQGDKVAKILKKD
jgi:6-phosphofructokinase 1